MTSDAASSIEHGGPRASTRRALVALLLALSVGFVALGVWQLERRVWKLALIERVDERVHAPPSDPPDRAHWASVDAADDEYRHVRLSGRFLEDRVTYVRALTDYGGGFWAIVPLRLETGDLVLVNRGFVERARPASAVSSALPAATGPVTVTGLLRIDEPRGTLLQTNDPATDRWYSRDVQAIAKARGLGPVAPYFVDADATPRPSSPDEPIGGLTVIAFRNDHLLYAITWFVLAALCGAALWRVFALRRRARW